MTVVRTRLRRGICGLFLLLQVFLAAACSRTEETPAGISRSLVYDHSLPLVYATQYSVDYYNQGFVLITISDGSRFLLNREGAAVPEDLPEDIRVLKGPVDHIYLAASAVMDMFDALQALDHITLSGIRPENWYIDAARQAMEDGRIQYAGKYNAPDYERILSDSCQLAIESTMILHAPEVKENLEQYGIPVLVDYTSYETHPLGRTEWVKLYGVLTGKEEEAAAAFQIQEQLYSQMGEVVPTGKTVVFFYLTSDGKAVVRKPGDYISKMIELAGGAYPFENLKEENQSATITLPMEDFYAQATDADYLVYNSMAEGELKSLSDLLDKNELLKDFKAVRSGNVWCASKNVYQGSMQSGRMIEEFHRMLTTEDQDGFTSLFKLQ